MENFLNVHLLQLVHFDNLPLNCDMEFASILQCFGLHLFYIYGSIIFSGVFSGKKVFGYGESPTMHSWRKESIIYIRHITFLQFAASQLELPLLIGSSHPHCSSPLVAT